MRFNDAPGPIGRHGARGKCGRGQRPLPAALRFMARATPLCAKAFAASRLVASAALPSFVTSSGQDFPGHIIPLSSETINPSRAVLKAQEGLFGRPFSGFARFSPRRAYYARGQNLPPCPIKVGRPFMLPCASWYRATPNGTKALAARATGGLGRFFAALRVMARATALMCQGACSLIRSVASTVPAPLRVMVRATPSCTKALGARDWWPQSTCPHSFFIGAGFFWTHYTTLLDLW